MQKEMRFHKILIVNDKLDEVEALQLILKQTEYQIFTCSSGKEAFAHIANDKPDLILLEARMAEVSGFDVCEKLKGDEETKNIVVIILAGLQRLEDKIRGLDCGADDFLTKPFQETELVARMRAHLRKKRAKDKLKEVDVELERLGKHTLEMVEPSQKMIEWNKVFIPTALAMSFSGVYVFLRYIVAKGVPLSHLPAHVFDKSMAISAVILMCASYIIGPMANLNQQKYGKYRNWRKALGISGLWLLLGHVLLAMATLTPSYLPQGFHKDGTMTGTFEISMTLGVIATLHLIFIGLISIQSVSREMTMKQWLLIQRSGLGALVLVFGHLFFMGYMNWTDSHKWYGGFMPSTMLASLMIVGTFLFRTYAKFQTRKSLA